MESETLSEERIRLRILELRKQANIELVYGNAATADGLLDRIAYLEDHLDQISKRGRKPAERKENNDPTA